MRALPPAVFFPGKWGSGSLALQCSSVARKVRYCTVPEYCGTNGPVHTPMSNLRFHENYAKQYGLQTDTTYNAAAAWAAMASLVTAIESAASTDPTQLGPKECISLD